MFKRVVLFPLLECEVQHKVVILLVDGLDLDLVGGAGAGQPSRSVPELLARHAHLFPRWLLPVFTTRQSSAITTHFPGFRRISIDDLRKTQVIQDIQQFILLRLQSDKNIARQITKDSTELLSLLHVKSAGCFLYIKKVLDGVSENYIELEEIREIPGTLNGLYLWLCLKQFNKKNFVKVRPLVNSLLAEESLSERELYEVVSMAGAVSSLETFHKYLGQLRPLLAGYRAGRAGPGTEQLALYHPSLAEWFTQTKFCGPVFACSSEDGRGMLAEWRTSLQDKQGQPDKPEQTVCQEKQEQQDKEGQEIGQETEQPDLLSGLAATQQQQQDQDADTMWMLLDTEERRKRKESLEPVETVEQDVLLLCVRAGDPARLARLLRSHGSNCAAEAATAALAAAREGAPDCLAVLLEAAGGPVTPDTTDEHGWSLLRTAAWAGQADCVALLVRAGAAVNRSDGEQRTALRAACWAGHIECVKVNGVVLYCLACAWFWPSSIIPVLQLLLEGGATVDCVDSEGRTSLIAACYMGHLDCVRELIIWGANIEICDQDGRTALSVAVTCEADSAAKLVTLLLDNGANPNLADRDQMTPLLIAAFEGE